MAKLTNAELIAIASNKNVSLINLMQYENLHSQMDIKCNVCGKTFQTDIETLRNKNFTCPCCEEQPVRYRVQPPPKAGYRIIGCDQATQHFGISVYDDGKLVYFDCIEFRGEVDERYVQIWNFMDQVIKTWQPDFVELEDIQLQQNGGIGGYNAFKILGGLLGVMKTVLRKNKIPYEEVLNKVWQAKFLIGGRDRATQKANVIKKVKSLFNIDVNDDTADAILIGKYGCMMHFNQPKNLF